MGLKTAVGKLTETLTQIGRCERAIRRDASRLTEEAHAQMTLMAALVKKAQELMAPEEEYGPAGSIPVADADFCHRGGGSAAGGAPLPSLSSPAGDICFQAGTIPEEEVNYGEENASPAVDDNGMASHVSETEYRKE